MLITELIEGGDLFDEFSKEGQLPEDQVRDIMKTVFGCINYCHQRGTVHRDLKPENIMLELPKEGDVQNFYQLKIIDFGLSKHFEKEAAQKQLKTTVGTEMYAASNSIFISINGICIIL